MPRHLAYLAALLFACHHDPRGPSDGGMEDLRRAADLQSADPDLSSPDLAPRGVSRAVTYQIDVAHTGAQPDDALRPPLRQRWATDVGSAGISYPLIADGRVFVTVRNSVGYGTKLHALDASTGRPLWGPADITGTYFWSAAAYENGMVFVINFDGLLRAFAADTGDLRWSTKLTQYAFSSAPTAVDGVVYVGGAGGGGTVFAVRATNGEVLWMAPVANGDNSSPAVGPTGVFVSYACNQAYAFEQKSGTQRWHHTSGCSGGGGKTTALYKDRLYTRDTDNLILDAATGNELGKHEGGTIPAFSGGQGVFQRGGNLFLVDLGSGARAWTFAGDGMLSSAPVIVGDYVYVGSFGGSVFAVERATGRAAWTGAAGGTIAGPDEQNVSQPLAGMAAAADLLVLAAGSKVVAFESAP